MAARGLKDLDDAVPPLTRALTMEIRTAHRNAGSPSFTLLDTRNVVAGRGTLAKSTLSRILTPDPAAKDQSLPAWSYYEGLLFALGVDPALYQPRWQAAQEEWQARARGQTAGLPAVLQPVSVGAGLPTSVLEREPLAESAMTPAPAQTQTPVPQPVTRLVTVGQKHSLTVLAAVAGSAAVVVAVGAFAFIGGSRSRPPAPATPNDHQTTAVLVTTEPPKTVTGKIVHTWNQDANNGRGGTIGVQVYPSPFALKGSTGPHHDGDIVEVVCHTAHGRLIHERLDTNRVNSTGWFEIYFENRLWWVPDHYISFGSGVQVPDCN